MILLYFIRGPCSSVNKRHWGIRGYTYLWLGKNFSFFIKILYYITFAYAVVKSLSFFCMGFPTFNFWLKTFDVDMFCKQKIDKSKKKIFAF